MRKTFLFLSVLLSLNANAGNGDNLNSALKMSLNSKINILPQSSQDRSSIFYGGQDIYPPLVAIAHEPVWEIPTKFMG